MTTAIVKQITLTRRKLLTTSCSESGTGSYLRTSRRKNYIRIRQTGTWCFRHCKKEEENTTTKNILKSIFDTCIVLFAYILSRFKSKKRQQENLITACVWYGSLIVGGFYSCEYRWQFIFEHGSPCTGISPSIVVISQKESSYFWSAIFLLGLTLSLRPKQWWSFELFYIADVYV